MDSHSQRAWSVTLLLCVFLGYLGVHRFYVGKWGTGVVWLATAGLLGFGVLYDVVLLLAGAFRDDRYALVAG
jgi:TM2 domain-containing membrane protein YozV